MNGDRFEDHRIRDPSYTGPIASLRKDRSAWTWLKEAIESERD